MIYFWEPAKLHVPTINLLLTKEEVAGFKELVFRGANLWPDAPPAIKELVDLTVNGKILQDYYSQAGVLRPDHSLGVSHGYPNQKSK